VLTLSLLTISLPSAYTFPAWQSLYFAHSSHSRALLPPHSRANARNLIEIASSHAMNTVAKNRLARPGSTSM
jgi:hypothetical protein